MYVLVCSLHSISLCIIPLPSFPLPPPLSPPLSPPLPPFSSLFPPSPLGLDKLFRHNFENNRCTKELRIIPRIIGSILAISRHGPIHTCTDETVRGEKMACTTVVAQRNHTFTFDESIWSSSRSIIRRLLSTLQYNKR